MTTPGEGVQHDGGVVSFDDEALILVDADDRETGSLPKVDCHLGDGQLHRAFSIFIFNSRGEVLLQQRAADKMLWPGYWANACCSHPRVGESVADAVHRRLQQEMGITADLDYVYKFTYKAHFEDVGTEHELCHVWRGTSDAEPAPNANEVAAWRYVTPAALDREMASVDAMLTPWLRLEWAELRARGIA